MVGRNKRVTTTAKVDVSDDEIAILDDEPQRQKGRGNKNLKTRKPPVEAELEHKTEPDVDEDDVLVGFDLTGVSDAEKAEIKRAILESKQDQSFNVSRDENGDEPDLKSSKIKGGVRQHHGASESDDDLVVAGDENNDEAGNSEEDCLAEHSPPTDEKEKVVEIVDDDDETQPPEDQEEDVDIEMDMTESTLQPDDGDYTRSTQKDEPVMANVTQVPSRSHITRAMAEKLKRGSSVNGVFTIEFAATLQFRDREKPEESEDLHLNQSVTDESMGPDHDDAPAKKKTKQAEEIFQDSDGFETTNSPKPELKRPTSSSRNSQSAILHGSHGSPRSQDSQGSERSQKGVASKSQPSVIQGHSRVCDNISPGSVKLDNASQGSMKHGSQLSTHSELDEHDVPLQRHYGGIKTKYVHEHSYFRSEGMDTVQCAKAIIQLFEIYSTKLKEAQRKCREREEWGQSVKSGQHQMKTIDIKRRGKDSVYIDLSEEEEDDDFQKAPGGRKTKKMENNSDDDLPELVIETTRSSIAKNRQGGSKNVEKEEPMSEETQKYDFEETEKNLNANASRSISRDHDTNKSGVLNTRNSRLTRGAKVLVEDTQQADREFQEALRRSKADVIVGETQADDNEDWLAIDRRKSQFENPMQKAQLKGYAIPKRNSVKVVNEKQTSTTQTYAKEQNENKKNFDKHADHGDWKNCANSSDANQNKTARGKKRKVDKEKPKTLVEDTQDMEAEPVTNTSQRGARHKRKCFMINSDSEVESIPDTQEMDLSPDIPAGKGKSKGEADDKIEKENEKPKPGLFSSVVNKVKDYASPHKTAVNDKDDEESQSPVIKRSRRLYKAPPQKFDNQVEDEAFEAFRRESGTKKDTNFVLNHETGELVKHGKKFQNNFDNETEAASQKTGGNVKLAKRIQDNDKDEMVTCQKGVKRLFSRPASKESSASDDVSVSSSQVSSTMIDDKGDLFSTQFPGKQLNLVRKTIII